jgi:hypothetical protein
MLTPFTRLAGLTAAIAITLIFAAFASQEASPRSVSADEPVITYISLEDGDVFSEPLQVIQICFEEPIDVRDLPPRDEGEFEFDLVRPNGLNVGMRIVFQGNGYGVTIFPGIESEGIIGEWTFHFQVRDRESLDPISDTLNYEVGEGGEPIITPTPQQCPSEGVTFAPTASPTAGPDGTPADGGSVDEDGDSDALVMSLVVIGAAAGLGALLLLAYLFRRRIGWWLHNPEDEPDSGEHH